MATWLCVQNCGACCHLQPDDRPDLDRYLDPEELSLYHSLVGVDGWCINYDQQTRQCGIYEERPSFCRVGVETFGRMFDIAPEELNDFAIDCCNQCIEDIYGESSPEMKRYQQAIEA